MSNIKDRVLLFIENQKLNKSIFFADLGLSYSNFKGIQKNSALNSDAIVSILTKYPNLSTDWLIKGKGEMIINNEKIENNIVSEPFEYYNIKDNNQIIEAQRETIEALKNSVVDLRTNNQLLQKLVEIKALS